MSKGTQTRNVKKGPVNSHMAATRIPATQKAGNGMPEPANKSTTDMPGYDFWTSVSAGELARVQGVRPIRRLGQVRAFTDPNPAEADWFAREVRRWRRNAGRTQRRKRN